MTTCAQCLQAFDITPEDLAFYEKVSPIFNGKKELIPPPTLCPDCRQQRRMARRNERKLYHRKSDASGSQIISIYRPDNHVVYSQTEWWSDDWDPLEYGREIDWNRSFFVQFAELQNVVPRLALTNKKQENSEYCNQSESLKDSYLLFGSIYSQNCLYGTRVLNSNDCVDCLWIDKCERCYECTDCKLCTNLLFCWTCTDTHDSRYSVDCTHSHDLLFCVGRKRASYQILNEQFEPEAFRKRKQEILESKEEMARCQSEFVKLLHSIPVRAVIGTQMENCVGNYIDQSSNAFNVFGVIQVQDVKYIHDAFNLKDAMDVYSFYGPGELCYEMYSAGVGMSRCLFGADCWPGDNLLYCDHCFNCKDCFGCTGLRHKQYCILNKQYSKEEYEELVPKLIGRMRQTKEWGEFFPVTASPFAYNETVADEYYPLTKDEVLGRGWIWHEEDQPADQYMGPDVSVPENIADVPDDITQKILRCTVTSKPYKVIPQELKFYREMQLPIPRKCPDQRHKERMTLRNPRRLWDRTCDNCQKQIQTTYAPDRHEIVYCEECYLSTVY
jgi:hypothetical protein